MSEVQVPEIQVVPEPPAPLVFADADISEVEFGTLPRKQKEIRMQIKKNPELNSEGASYVFFLDLNPLITIFSTYFPSYCLYIHVRLTDGIARIFQ